MLVVSSSGPPKQFLITCSRILLRNYINFTSCLRNPPLSVALQAPGPSVFLRSSRIINSDPIYMFFRCPWLSLTWIPFRLAWCFLGCVPSLELTSPCHQGSCSPLVQKSFSLIGDRGKTGWESSSFSVTSDLLASGPDSKPGPFPCFCSRYNTF